MSGTGTQSDPWDLATALASPKVKPGHTLHLAPGTYTGEFTSTLQGAAGSPITIKPDGPVVIDGGLIINGQDTLWRDFEIMFSGWTTRETEIAGSSPPDILAPDAAIIYGPRTVLANCILHDTRQGCGFWEEAVDAEIYGCVMFNNGWVGPDRNHGHSVYIQNLTGTKKLTNNIMPGSYSDYSIHAYTEAGHIQGFDMGGNVSVGKHLLIGGAQPVARLALRGNLLYGGALRVGYSPSVNNLDAILTGNILGGGAIRQTSGNWNSLTETGTDLNPRDRIIILPNEYDARRAHVVIYNQAGVSAVSVDLSSLRLPKGAYRLRNAQNYLNEWHAFTLNGAIVSVPMTGWTVAVPIGASRPIAVSTFPAFGAFVLEPA